MDRREISYTYIDFGTGVSISRLCLLSYTVGRPVLSQFMCVTFHTTHGCSFQYFVCAVNAKVSPVVLEVVFKPRGRVSSQCPRQGYQSLREAGLYVSKIRHAFKTRPTEHLLCGERCLLVARRLLVLPNSVVQVPGNPLCHFSFSRKCFVCLFPGLNKHNCALSFICFKMLLRKYTFLY